jgi:serine protease Do
VFQRAVLDPRSFDVNIVGRDPLVDLALLRATAADGPLPFLPLGSSERLRPRDWAVTLGSRPA